ncbi:hypothetical protein BABINDRAFT_8746 [Babjeviella inositovora NRRL Y-12698]|uniref:Exportin-1/Importin-beta-like domain-containing protein n=1 Tax=Babjeviella inositovora NRRL Y-12698 TaxID=984486 RepID=A0A1E3QNA1_9ASCO|nr:uncharacterized protein BABINDRAFT_8746 [Babjeviella inositovora NRRL Y-12698]ODQ79151.1 hypothetical protein BABINDRAFT_8746 [Babjeviella inositovora NRRL Y-12698]
MSYLSIQQVARLVESLYTIRDPEQVSVVQKELQALQRSEYGWTIAHELLQQESANCKFFGALTYTVNLNRADFADASVQTALLQIMDHLVALLTRADLAIVVRKLLSNISLIYVKSFRDWPNPVATVWYVIHLQRPVVREDLTHAVAPEALRETLSTASAAQIATLVLFCRILVEDVIKNERTSTDYSSEIHLAIHANVFPAAEPFLRAMLAALHSTGVVLATDSLECLHAWIQYICVAETESIARFDIYGLLLDLLTATVSQSDHDVSAKCLDVWTEVLETTPMVVNRKTDIKDRLQEVLFGPWGTSYLNYYAQEDDRDLLAQFSRLAIAFLELNVVRVSSELCNAEHDSRFEFLLHLTNYPGMPVVDEDISLQFIEFWSQLAECFIDDAELVHHALGGDAEKIARVNIKSVDLFSRVSVIYWGKIHLTGDTKTDEFYSYRRDVADLFDTIYPIVKFPLFQNLVDSVEQKTKPSDVEASLYLLNHMAANFGDASEEALRAVESIFSGGILSYVTAQNEPSLTAITIRFLSSIDFFYKHVLGVSHLPSILEFLFDSLLHSQSQLLTSKTIVTISSECRVSLVEYLPHFERLLVMVIDNVTVEGLIRERILNSYASIIQSMKNPQTQGQVLDKLLSLISNKAGVLISHFDPLMADYAVSLLSSVYEVGKGMLVPDEAEDFYTPQEQASVVEYWTADPLGIRAKVMAIVVQFSQDPHLSRSKEVTEKCCQILRVGLRETITGPFVFPNAALFDYIVGKFAITGPTSVPYLFGLFETIVNINFRQLSVIDVAPLVDCLFVDQQLSDPDLVDSCLLLFATMAEQQPMLVVGLPVFHAQVVPFVIDSLASHEKFVLRASSRFWCKLIVLRKGTRDDRSVVDGLFANEAFCQAFVTTFMTAFLGASRSNLDYYTEIVRVLLAKYPMPLKKWLLSCLEAKKVAGAEKFIGKLMVTRGQRRAVEVMKDFWLDINGLINYSKK